MTVHMYSVLAKKSWNIRWLLLRLKLQCYSSEIE